MINHGVKGAIFDWLNDAKNDTEFHKSRFLRVDCIPLSCDTWAYLEEEVPQHDFWEIGELDEYANLEGISVFYLRELNRHGWLNDELKTWHERLEADEKLRGKIPCESHCCHNGPMYGSFLLDYDGADSIRECATCVERSSLSRELAGIA